jgi:hypothetical protein
LLSLQAAPGRSAPWPSTLSAAVAHAGPRLPAVRAAGCPRLVTCATSSIPALPSSTAEVPSAPRTPGRRAKEEVVVLHDPANPRINTVYV